MRARAAVSAALASAGILLAGWQSGVHVADTRSVVAAASTGNAAGSSSELDTSDSSGTGTSGSSGTGTSGTAGSSGTGSAGAAAKAGGTYDGDVVQTRFGSVQVQITVKAGTITDVTALKLTDHEGRSVQISNYAAPILRSEVLQAQSADVQTVGGATVTSDAYLTSLQAALDAANL